MKRQILVGSALFASLCGTLAFAETRINAAGATFPYPIYSKWFSEFKAEKGVEINYQSIGSGGGISQLTQGTVDFGASDRPLTDAEIGKMKSKPVIFATVLGGIVPTYNVAGITKDMKFTGEALAGIFLGAITKWNDPALKAANPGVNLPNADIVVVHRSDGSGTSFVFTDYLSKVSPEWKSKVGANQSPNWPVGLAAKGNEGVAGLVKQTPGSIGYVELNYAVQNKMAYGEMKNAAGKFLKADLASVTAAGATAKTLPASITNAAGANAYPISTFTYLLIPSKIDDAAKRTAITDFLKWMLAKGQTYSEGLDYAKLPASIVAQEQKQIAEIQ
jgi:phosphate transport system substrate-binding protein